MSRFQKVIWSPVEIEYLKKHRNDMPVDQLTIALAKSRNAIKKKLDEFDGKIDPKKKLKSPSKIGRREDIKQFTRSAWEANFIRYLNYKGIKWQYESEIFIFPGVKKGTVSYTPDFYLPELDIYIEIKGYLKPQNKTATRRLKKHFPEIFKKLQCIPGSNKTAAAKFYDSMDIPVYAYYNELNKEYKDIISYWE